MPTTDLETILPNLAKRLPLKRVSQAQALELLGADPKDIAKGTLWLTRLEIAGLITRHGTYVERVRYPLPPAQPKRDIWQPGDPGPEIIAGLPTPDGGWIEVPQSEVDATIAGFKEDRESRRVGQLKSELTTLGVLP